MSGIPQTLEEWTYSRIDDLVNNNVNESETHDFKSDIPDSIELTKDCCAFANTKGGFIILGIKETRQRFIIAGIDSDNDLANKFGKKINALPTNPEFKLGNFINIPESDKVLAVIHVPKSSYRPHIPSPKDKGIFWKRTNTGNEQMTYGEIRESFREVLLKEEGSRFNEVKFRLLFALYRKHYSKELRQQQITAKVIEEANLSYFEPDLVYGDIVYLEERGFVRVQHTLGMSYPFSLIITAQGIDETKKLIEGFIRFLREESESDYRHINAVVATSDKLTEIWRILNQNHSLCKKFFAASESL